MKKSLCEFLVILLGIGSILLLTKKEFTIRLCVSDIAAVRAAQTAKLEIAGERELDDMESVGMQIIYQLARRSVVKVVVKDAAGSGIIWNTDNGIVIVSNRHLLMKDVKAKVVFRNGESITSEVVGYSQQYDLGFIKIPEDGVTNSILRDIYEVVPALYDTESEDAKKAFVSNNFDKCVLQIGAIIDKNTANVSVGNIKDLKFVPLFNTNMLETACFSRAGMSGGGVFDEGGRFLGMISGGEVSEDAQEREAEITYSIPATLIAAEYEIIIGDDQ